MKSIKIAFFLFIFFNVSFGFEVYTTGINIKKTIEGIKVEWKSKTNSYEFLIFRSFEEPIDSPEKLEKSELIFSNILYGEEREDFFVFKYIDKPIYNKNIYYFVSPVKKISKEDFLVNINLNYKPFFIALEELKITNFFGKRYKDGILLFWDIEGELKKDEYFEVYRSNKEIKDLSLLQPYKTNIRDYFFEDLNVSNEEYFYVVVLNNNKRISENNLIRIDKTYLPGSEIEIVKELKNRKIIRKEDFIRKFTNQGKENE